MYARDTAFIATPVGTIWIEADDEELLRIAILTSLESVALIRGSAGIVRLASLQLEEYFAGERRDFDLPLLPPRTPRGGVLRNAISAIAYGATATYGDVARSVASSPRAIGQACRLNRFPIVVPCHRVIGGTGHYSAGDGLPTKEALLRREHERNVTWAK